MKYNACFTAVAAELASMPNEKKKIINGYTWSNGEPLWESVLFVATSQITLVVERIELFTSVILFLVVIVRMKYGLLEDGMTPKGYFQDSRSNKWNFGIPLCGQTEISNELLSLLWNPIF